MTYIVLQSSHGDDRDNDVHDAIPDFNISLAEVEQTLSRISIFKAPALDGIPN